VYAPRMIGTLLREFMLRHSNQLKPVLATHLDRLCRRVDLLPGARQRAFVNIDSPLRPCHAHTPFRSGSFDGVGGLRTGRSCLPDDVHSCL